MSNDRPIGVFDSGIGGLTVVRNIIRLLPKESIIYFGDIARIPYGTKSQDTIKKFATQTAKFLVDQRVKVIIIACNTISAIAKNEVIAVAKNIPVIDVISAGVESISLESKNVAIIATPATINSQVYQQKLLEISSGFKIYPKACGLFVPMIEEGFISGSIVNGIVKKYLQDFKNIELDEIILGCTHYPIIENSISKYVEHTNIVNPSYKVSQTLRKLLEVEDLFNHGNNPVQYDYFVTDIPINFKSIGEIILKRPMNNIKKVDFD